MQIDALPERNALEIRCPNVLRIDAVVLPTLVVKNGHLGFRVQYLWNGATRRYVPDFVVRLANGKTLVLEMKGEDSEQNRAKRAAMEAWVAAVNAKGGFGVWCSDVAYAVAGLRDVLDRHAHG